MTEKRFPPSIQRLQRARREGKVVKSRIVSSAFAWLCISLLLVATHPWVRIGTLIHWFKFKVLTPGETFTLSLLVALGAALVCGGVVAAASVLSGLLQTRGLVSVTQLVPDLKRVQPGRYISRMRDAFGDALLGMARVSLLVIVLSPLLVMVVAHAGELFRAPEEFVVPVLGAYLSSAIVRSWGVMLVIGGMSYWCVRWRFMKQHRMSLEEVKEEYKESEGDPHFRAARKHEHQALAMADVERRVRNSKVLIIRKRPTPARR